MASVNLENMRLVTSAWKDPDHTNGEEGNPEHVTEFGAEQSEAAWSSLCRKAAPTDGSRDRTGTGQAEGRAGRPPPALFLRGAVARVVHLIIEKD